MFRLPIMLMAIALAAGPTVAPRADASLRDQTSRTLELPEHLGVSVVATVGDVTIVGSDRTDVTVRIDRSASAGITLGTVSNTIEHGAEGLRIAAIQKDGANDARARGSVTIRAPSSQRFDAVTLFEGRISLRGLHGGVRATVERGSIDASDLAGAVRLETTIGSIRVDPVSLESAGMLRLRTFNGDVDLRFSESPRNARILALSLGGTIKSDLPLTLRTAFGPRFAEATFGRGEPLVSIDVVKGNIRIASGR